LPLDLLSTPLYPLFLLCTPSFTMTSFKQIKALCWGSFKHVVDLLNGLIALVSVLRVRLGQKKQVPHLGCDKNSCKATHTQSTMGGTTLRAAPPILAQRRKIGWRIVKMCRFSSAKWFWPSIFPQHACMPEASSMHVEDKAEPKTCCWLLQVACCY
jgi:hypothetical protein